ncbi:hypothetical protein [Streptomyces sp. B93]|uniref:hypothetical protein n=1 Tax=Streptomyces sp. B93 TaxID=2824875 RepID=UPI001B366AAC|nr:hypothetical protein [Streptomyces sp. B93]MBQ1090645.1 hypothetical protein [Streptomyces sp. B93]
MGAPAEAAVERSAECALATQRLEHRRLHADCRRTKDIPLPHGRGLLLVRRCGCACHRKQDANT